MRVGFDQAPDPCDAGELVADDYRPCQQAADRWRGAGVTAAIVPSAALPGTENLVVFGQRLAVAWLGQSWIPTSTYPLHCPPTL